MTGQKLYERAIAIIDELSETGTATATQKKEYSNRAPFLLDMFQRENAKIGIAPKTFEMVRSRRANLLGDLGHYGNIKENNGETQVYSVKGANCFYFETDGDCTVKIQGDGVDLSGYYVFNGGVSTSFTGTISISVPAGTTSFLTVKGIFTPASQASTITMTISGTYYFRHNNRALCAYKFASADSVPDFKPWVKIDMPSDFQRRTQIIDETGGWLYNESHDHKWEGNSELYVLFSYEGLIRIKYIPIPVEITVLTQTLELNDEVAQAGAYYLAEHFALADQNDELAKMCRNKYRELKVESMLKEPLPVSEIIDVYGWGGD
jgi:hypothetical protein